MKYILSPEFHRNLWLRFTPFRLVAAPVFLALIVMIKTGADDTVIDRAAESALLNVMSAIFFITVVLWGTYEAATAMQEEMRGNTWDFQRMSSVSPAQLAFGKLFGATSFTWYFGLLALGIWGFVYSGYVPRGSAFDMRGAYALPEPPDDTVYVMLLMVASGLIAQSLAFVTGLLDLSMLTPGIGRLRLPRGIVGFMIGFVPGSVVFFTIAKEGAVRLMSRTDAMYHNHLEAGWYYTEWPRDALVTCSLAFLVFWFLMAGYRAVRAELMYRNLPFVWMAFVASFVAWFCGFVAQPSSFHEPDVPVLLATGYIAALGICYATVFIEAADTRRYTRLAYHASRGELLRALENVPKWLSAAPVALALLVAALVALSQGQMTHAGLNFVQMACFLVALTLFAVRDGCVVHLVHRALSGRGVSFVLMFYYVLAYAVLPMLAFSTAHHDLGRAINDVFEGRVPGEVQRIASYFYPIPSSNFLRCILPALAQAAAAATALFTLINRPARPQAQA